MTSSESRSLLQVATEHPGISVPLFAGAGALVSLVAVGRHVVSGLVRYHGIPPDGNLFASLFLLFDLAVLSVCVLVLRRTVQRQGWRRTLRLLREIFGEMAIADRLVAVLIGLSVVAFLYAFLVL